MKDVIQAGARQAVAHCVDVRPGEQVVVIADRETRHLAEALIAEIKALDAVPTQFVMEDFGSREGPEPLAFPAVMAEALAEAQASFYIAQCKAGELNSFRMPMIDVVQTYRLRHAHMPGFTEVMMSQGMASDYKAIQDFESYTFDTDDHSSRLGEFAIGTNIGLTGLIGNLLQDEKYPGIHLALGNPYPEKTGADWRSRAHCDGVLIKPTINVEGRTIMQDGAFCL